MTIDKLLYWVSSIYTDLPDEETESAGDVDEADDGDGDDAGLLDSPSCPWVRWQWVKACLAYSWVELALGRRTVRYPDTATANYTVVNFISMPWYLQAHKLWPAQADSTNQYHNTSDNSQCDKLTEYLFINKGWDWFSL